LYADWQEKPILTTVTSTAIPVSEVSFPAVTICSKGQSKEKAMYLNLFSMVRTFLYEK